MIRVPARSSGAPAACRRDSTSRSRSQLIDVMPTLLELSGLAAAEGRCRGRACGRCSSRRAAAAAPAAAGSAGPSSPRSSRSAGHELPERQRVLRDRGRRLEAHPQRRAAAGEAGVRAVRLLQGPARPDEPGRRAAGRRRAPGEAARRAGSAWRGAARLKPDSEATKGMTRRAARAAAQPGLREVTRERPRPGAA